MRTLPVALPIFIMQNTTEVAISFFGLSSQLPTAVALLFAAIAGVLLLAVPITIRTLQLRNTARTAGVAPPHAHHREGELPW